MTFDSAYPDLKLFVDKASKLEDSGFVKSISEEFRLGLNIEVGKPMEVTSVRPNQESIEAFVLTFRFFIQDNDAISIRKIKDVFKSNIVTNDEKNKFNTIRSNLNIFLGESSSLIFYQEDLKNRVIMDTIIYGNLSHANPNKKQKYDSWMQREDFVDLIWHKFVTIIYTVLHAVKCIRDIIVNILSRYINA